MTRTTGDHGGKAVLLEVDRDFGFALTPDGRFVRVRCRSQDEEGQEIDRDRAVGSGRAAHRVFGRGRRKGWALRPGLAAGLAAVLCLIVLSPFAVGRVLASGNPVVYVSVDINPSLEFGVNRWDRAVSALGLNPDGEALLGKLRWRGRPVADVVAEVGSAAASQGFLGGHPGELLVAAVPAVPGRTVPPGLEKQLAKVCAALEATLAAGGAGGQAPEVTVETVVADASNLRDQAVKLGLSVGEYAVLLAAQEAGLDVDRDDLGRGLGQAIITAGGQPGEILREAHGNREISKLAKKFGKRNGLDPDDEGQSTGIAGGEDQATGAGSGEQGGQPSGAGSGSGQDQGAGGNGQGQGRDQGNGHHTTGAGSNDSGGDQGGSGRGPHPGHSAGDQDGDTHDGGSGHRGSRDGRDEEGEDGTGG